MGCTHHLHSLRHHRVLWAYLRLPQSLHHPHRHHPTDEARHVPEQKGEFHGEAPLPHYGDDGGDLRCHPGHRTHDGYPELRGDGKPVAGGVCLADWSHPGFHPAACGQRQDQEHLPHLFSTDADRLHRHRIPYHPDTKRFGKPNLPSYPSILFPVAVECDSQEAQPGVAHRQDLRLYLAGCLCGNHRQCLGRFHLARRTDYHLVDHAAHLRTHHHLLRGMAQRICQAQKPAQQGHHREMGLSLCL